MGWIALTRDDVVRDLSPYDLKRLDSYARSMVDYHVIVDLVPTVAQHLFLGNAALALAPSLLSVSIHTHTCRGGGMKPVAHSLGTWECGVWGCC
jgi:tRNA(Met) C34 N-acetyltransferase TmcA